MISLATAADILHGGYPKTEALLTQCLADELCSRVLDVIEPGSVRWKHLCDGTSEPWVTIRKPMPGIPAGMCMRLADLHERLMGSLYAK